MRDKGFICFLEILDDEHNDFYFEQVLLNN